MKPVAWQVVASELVNRIAPVEQEETVTVHRSVGRALAADMTADRPLPIFDHAVMDGFALGAQSAGRYHLLPASARALASDEAAPIAAGSAIPMHTAAVVLAHAATQSGGELVVPFPPERDNIRRAGEEARAGDILVKAGRKLDARHTALAIAAGRNMLQVRVRPRIALLGLQDSHIKLPHVMVLASLLESPLLSLTLAGVMRPGDLGHRLPQIAATHDLVIVVAESLRGEDSALCAAIEAAAGDSAVWRAQLKPAKPIIVGNAGRTTILGLAGTAYAVVTAAHLFLMPMLRRLCALPDIRLQEPAVSGFARSRIPGRAEALPVLVDRRTGLPLLMPAGRFGQLRALADMDGIALVDADQGDIARGTTLSYMPVHFPLV